jgi:2-phospho-L-lactate guanylyltransferase
MSCWALVPIKARAQCKTRLAGVLDPRARIALVRAMLRQTLDTLGSVAAIEGIAVLGPERDGVPEQVLQLPDAGAGLNAALAAALPELARRGASMVLVLPADLPLLTADDVRAMIDAGRRSAYAIAPDRHERGTNALCLSLPMAPLRFQFGPDSHALHCADAAAQGFAPATLRLPGLSFDLDDAEDWRLLPARRRAGLLLAAELA